MKISEHKEKQTNLEKFLKEREEKIKSLGNWPKPGDKLKFTGKTFCFHSDVAANADKLVLGQEYVVKECSPASSWCAIYLTDFPGDTFSLSFFDWNSEKPLDKLQNPAKV